MKFLTTREELRNAKPYSQREQREIRGLVRGGTVASLMAALPKMQQDPRRQRLAQEAIERKRRDGR